MSKPRPVALVTGSVQRVGAAIAATLARAGWTVALHARHQHDLDPALVAALADAGQSPQLFLADLAEPDGPDRLFDAVSEGLGTPRLVVNNASIFAEDEVSRLEAETLTQTLAVNTIAPVLLARRLAGRGGSAVVNILDQRVAMPVPDQIGYTISKQALWQATRTLAVALAPHVRVNAVAPGVTLPARNYEEGRMERLVAHMPLERLSTPQGIADAVLYLARAEEVSGQTICVDGGANLRGYPRDFAYL